MRKVLFLLLLATAAHAEGPLFRSSDTITQQEFENVYQDIRNPRMDSGRAKVFTADSLTVSTITAVSSATITNLTVTNLAGFSSGKLKQLQTATTSSASATASATYQNTALAVTITPTATTSKFVIIAHFNAYNGSSGQSCFFTTTGTTTGNLAGASGGAQLTAAAVNQLFPVTILAYDTPGTVAAQTYTVQMKAPGGTCNFNDGEVSRIVVFEVAP